MPSPTTRKTLLARVVAGDELGWEEFYHAYKGLIVAIALETTHNIPQDSLADIVQNVMCAVFNNGRMGYDPARGIKFRAWFSGIVRNKINDFWRSKCRLDGREKDKQSKKDIADNLEFSKERAPAKPLVKQPWEFEADWRKQLDTIFEAEWRKHLVVQAMDQLKMEVDAATYQAFEMNVVQERTPKDVATATGMTVENVYVCKSRCVKRLRSILTELKKTM